MEHRGAQRGDLARSPGPLDEPEPSRDRLATLLGGGSTHICHPWQDRITEPATELDEHRGPALKQRARPCVAWRALRAVSVELLEVEES